MIIFGYLLVCAALAITYALSVYISDREGRHIPHVLETRYIRILYFPSVLMIMGIESVTSKI